MASKKARPLDEAILHLRQALEACRAKPKDALAFMAVSKAFEVAVEYGWRELKRRVEDEGLEAPSPKDAVRKAAKLHFIKDPEAWLTAIEGRNASVHDYFGIGEKELLELAETFLSLAEKIQKH